MVECDDEDCSIEWFHTECLRITTVPKDKWVLLRLSQTSKV